MGRPIKEDSLSGQVQLSAVVAAAEKSDVIRVSQQAGRSLSREVELRLRWYREQRGRLGVDRVGTLLLGLAEVIQKRHGLDDGWLDRAADYSATADELVDYLASAAPDGAVISRERAAPPPVSSGFASAWVMAQMMLLVRGEREPDERTIAAHIASSPELSLLADFETTAPAAAIRQRREAMLLEHARAIEYAEQRLLSETDLWSLVPEPPEGESRVPAAHMFESSWRAATAFAQDAPHNLVDPSEQAVAVIFASDPALVFNAMLRPGTTAAEILAKRAEFAQATADTIEWLQATAPAEPEPEPENC